MTTKRGRPGIKPHIRQLICVKALENKTPRLALAIELKNLIEEMGELPPSEETMMRLISEARNHPNSPLDEPWSVATLDDYPIPPDVLPVVLELSVHMREFQTFTIRNAKWAARICRTTTKWIELAKMVLKYSATEMIHEITKSSFDSTELDLELYTLSTQKEISDKQKNKMFSGSKVGDAMFSREVIEEDIRQMRKQHRELSAQGLDEEAIKQKLKELRIAKQREARNERSCNQTVQE